MFIEQNYIIRGYYNCLVNVVGATLLDWFSAKWGNHLM